MTSIPTPEAVEPMTDGELAAERHHLLLGGGVTWSARDMARFFATIDALAARALPTPRRYTGGPLEDGVYLIKSPRWPEWETHEAWPGISGPYVAPVNGFLWLIGPIPIPNLPEEEKANG